MEETKKIAVEFDDTSREILKKVDVFHRSSLINMALRVIAKSEYYKTLTNETTSESLDDMASLSMEDIGEKKETKKKEEVKEVKKPTTTWDSF